MTQKRSTEFTCTKKRYLEVRVGVADPNTGPPNVGETMFQKHWTTDLEETNQHWTMEQCSRNTPTTKEEKKERRDEQSTIKSWTCQTKMIRYWSKFKSMIHHGIKIETKMVKTYVQGPNLTNQTLKRT